MDGRPLDPWAPLSLAKSFKFILSYQNKSLASTDNSQMALSRVRTASSTLLAKVLHPTTRSFSTSANAYDLLTHSTPSRKTAMMMNQMFTADLSSQIGSCMPISMMRIGTLIHNIEMNPGQGGKLVRAAGTSAKILKEPKASRHCLIKLPSGKEKLIDSRCRATIGTVSNPEHGAKKLRKAGQSRWLGRRPVVRGVAMNPVDHPHGGGEGRSKSSGSHGRSSRTPWGKPCKSGFKTGPLKKRRGRSDSGSSGCYGIGDGDSGCGDGGGGDSGSGDIVKTLIKF
ncbi:hypothetical protein HYC85_017367 [Camellia sinensis]|uniref:Large ribosomal subunit protein uL2 C-terminal domain-containing protein n=1 Tax=Camellia sinensis TaxID=4442 RepID=A0A7J7H2F2_CAMSI|nr:hypothetical protein HYC85_017367 [Camellia sinensis]